MAVYSFLQICEYYGYKETKTREHIKKLVKEKKFRKTCLGKGYNDRDLKILSQLLGFALPESFKKKLAD